MSVAYVLRIVSIWLLFVPLESIFRLYTHNSTLAIVFFTQSESQP